MDEIKTKINDMIAEINETENLDIDFPDSYIEDLAEHYISRELTDDELKELIFKLTHQQSLYLNSQIPFLLLLQ